MKERVHFPWIQEYIKQLKLTWDVIITCNTEYDWWLTTSDPAKRSHEIAVARSDRGDLEAVISEITRALCLAKFAEDIHPLFSTFHFSTSCKTRKDTYSFNDRLLVMYFSLYHTNIWADTLRHTVIPALTERDQRYFMKKLGNLLERGGQGAVDRIDVLMALARYRTQCIRTDIREADVYRRIEYKLRPDRRNIFNAITSHLEKLPNLPESNPQKALTTLEYHTVILAESVGKLLESRMVVICPRISNEHNTLVWRF